MKPIFSWELRQRKSYILWWSIITLLVVGLLLLIFPSIRDQANQFNKLLNQLPNGLRQLKTGGANQINVADPIAYLNSQLYYITLPLVQIIMAINLGGSLLARDEQNHTLELLLARPISRGRLLIAKALAGVAALSIATLAGMLLVMIVGPPIQLHVGIGALLLTNLFSMLFSLSFGAIAFGLSASAQLARRASVGIAVFIGFGGYLITSLSGLSHYLVNPAKVAPYHYYDPTTLLHGHVNAGLLIYLAIAFVGSALLAWVGFRRRDIS